MKQWVCFYKIANLAVFNGEVNTEVIMINIRKTDSYILILWQYDLNIIFYLHIHP